MVLAMSWLCLAYPPFPTLRVQVSDTRVTHLSWGPRPSRKPKRDLSANTADEETLLKELEQDLRTYFKGQHVTFDWPLDWGQGTPFQRKVWQSLQKVPYGETRSYSWLAQQVGRPRAIRAVGNANGKNPFSLVVPCHRIIHKSGGLGGYTGGLHIKRHLLNLETHA